MEKNNSTALYLYFTGPLKQLQYCKQGHKSWGVGGHIPPLFGQRGIHI